MEGMKVSNQFAFKWCASTSRSMGLPNFGRCSTHCFSLVLVVSYPFLLLLCFGFGDQRVGMTVNEFPGVAFEPEEFGYAQVEGDGLCSAMQVSRGALETDPVGQAVARRHVQYLKLTLAAALEDRGVTFVL